MIKQTTKKRMTFITTIFVSLLLLAACGGEGAEPDTDAPDAGGAADTGEMVLLEQPLERREFLMGTQVVLRVYDEGKEDALDDAISRIEELEEKLTSNAPGSEIDAINQAAGKEAVEVSGDTFELLEKAAEYSALAGGGFDLTVGPLVNLWRIGFDDARVPAPEEIDAALPMINHEKVELNAGESTVYLPEADMNIDLGAIAKGYIADEVMEVFAAHEVTTAIVDLGGNVVVLGDSPTREEGGWNVGIQDPFLARGKIVGYINLTDISVVTSGIYERYLEADGETYHHLLNPETGYPFDNEIAGVSIITEKSVTADALSTAVFALGLEDGLEFVNSEPGVEAVFITKDKKLYTSEGLREMFQLSNEEFTWVNQ